MNINITLKLRSLLRRKQQFHCISYNWDTNQIVLTETNQQYQQQLTSLKNYGYIKRAQCYLDSPFIVDQHEKYLIYMISFGDFRKGKMVKGENPLAKGLGICLFDYVYIFIDTFRKAQRRMEKRIQQMEKNGDLFHRNLMLSLYQKYFSDYSDITQTSQILDTIKNCAQEQRQQSFST